MSKQQSKIENLKSKIQMGLTMILKHSKPLTYWLNILLILTLLYSILSPVHLALASAIAGDSAGRSQPLSNKVVAPATDTTTTKAALLPAQSETNAAALHASAPISGRADLPASAPGSARTNLSPRAQAGRQSGLMFIENVGQFDAEARFMVRGANGILHLADDALWFTVLEPPDEEARVQLPNERGPRPNPQALPKPRRGVNLKLTFPGANARSRLEPFARLDTQVSYFTGNDPAQWQTNVPVWGGVRYVDFYPGIDLELTAENGQLAQRLVVRRKVEAQLQQIPGAVAPVPRRPSMQEIFGTEVRLRIEGTKALTAGDYALQMDTAVGKFSLPLLDVVAADGTRLDLSVTPPAINGQEIAAPFSVVSTASVSPPSPVRIRTHLASPLLTAPLQQGASDLLYATFLGGVSDDVGCDIAVDGAGYTYVTGWTSSSNFPTTPGAYDTYNGGYYDAFIVKLNANGTQLDYAIFLGGEDDDYGSSIVVDGAGKAYVTGGTRSSDFPTTPGAYDEGHNGSDDVFIVKLNASGTGLDYATFLGGENQDEGYGIVVDGVGKAYITGGTYSSGFPTTPGAYDESYNGGYYDAFIVKLDAGGTGLDYATFLGGGSYDYGIDIAVNGAGNAYITGGTYSSGFPTTPGAYDESYNGGYGDAFVVKVNADGTDLDYATFLGGGSSEEGDSSIAVDGTGNAYVTGVTQSSDFPTTPGAYDESYNGGYYDAFVVKLNANGTELDYATFLGGGDDDFGNSIAVEGAGKAYVTGRTYSSDFPTTSGAYDESHNGGSDAFIVKLNTSGTGLDYATFLGGVSWEDGYSIAVDGAGKAYITGRTYSSDFPTTAGAYDTGFNNNYGYTDAFVAKLALGLQPVKVEVLDLDGNPVNALNLNDDGWPTPNPLMVQVTLSCPAGGAYCSHFFELTIDSDDDARFYLYDKDLNSDEIEVSCVESFFGSEFSHSRYTVGCATPPLGTLKLNAGQTKTIYWLVWVQPSTDASLKFSALWHTPLVESYIDIKEITIEQAQIHPIVFIHGLGAALPGGSQDWFLSLQVGTNLVTRYTNLFDTLEKMGYEFDRTLFLYNYDWLLDVYKEAATKLRPTILDPATQTILDDTFLNEPVTWVKRYPGDQIKFDIVTHSTGAMVARAYIQTDLFQNDIHRLVTVAGPHRGVSKIYKGWEGGDPSLEELDYFLLGFEVPARAMDQGIGHPECLFDTLCVWVLTPEEQYEFIHNPVYGATIMPQFFLVLDDDEPALLLDVANNDRYPFDYQANPLWQSVEAVTGPCRDENDDPNDAGNDGIPNVWNVCDPYENYDVSTTYHGLNTPDEMKLLNEQLGLDNIAVIYGNGIEDNGDGLQMIESFDVGRPRNSAPYWRNGEPKSSPTNGEIYGPGDGTITAISANPVKIWVDENGDPIDMGFTLNDNGDMVITGDIIPIVHNPNDNKPSAFNVERMHDERTTADPNITPGDLVHASLVGYTETQDAVVRALTQIELPANFIEEYGPDEAAADKAEFEETASTGLFITVFSPVELTLTDDQGRRLGYDSAAGDDLFEIPHGIYVRETETDRKSILIFSPPAGETTLTLTGVDTGEYTLLAYFGDEQGIANLFVLTGTTTVGQIETMTVTVPSTSTEVATPPNVRAGSDLFASPGQPLTFAGQFDDFNPADTHQVSWDFGDGSTAVNTLTPTYTFTNEGLFTVTLTVTDSTGFVVDDSLIVTVASAFQEVGGQVVIEAEHFAGKVERNGRAWMTQTVLTGYAGTGYVSALPDTDLQFPTTYFTTNPELSYTINFTTTGLYTVWLRGYAPNGAGDSIYLGLAGPNELTSTLVTGFRPGTWDWTDDSTSNEAATLEITKPGIYTLYLWQREDGLRVDRILLTTNSAYQPAGVGPLESDIR